MDKLSLKVLKKLKNVRDTIARKEILDDFAWDVG